MPLTEDEKKDFDFRMAEISDRRERRQFWIQIIQMLIAALPGIFGAYYAAQSSSKIDQTNVKLVSADEDRERLETKLDSQVEKTEQVAKQTKAVATKVEDQAAAIKDKVQAVSEKVESIGPMGAPQQSPAREPPSGFHFDP